MLSPPVSDQMTCMIAMKKPKMTQLAPTTQTQKEGEEKQRQETEKEVRSPCCTVRKTMPGLIAAEHLPRRDEDEQQLRETPKEACRSIDFEKTPTQEFSTHVLPGRSEQESQMHCFRQQMVLKHTTKDWMPLPPFQDSEQTTCMRSKKIPQISKCQSKTLH
eukprot:gnl/MRDRNA2_/MRDRNA2_82150_c0_seq1.p1 gnl/MRDRNA2_/MRDRNA2_82150_c0~~gnl/MRDRNA2_/MRDRNA2_82150_c0_seq1.p1  ORF type:complete len:161 (+),score=27.53 gnl/MRDRNA2_/MRDRNA2_82150_c0_seq1:214-696(+)